MNEDLFERLRSGPWRGFDPNIVPQEVSRDIGPAGFSTALQNFADQGRVYNASFATGTENSIAATTIVGTADNPSSYAASQSLDIPYWIVDVLTGAGSFGRIEDTAAPNGFAVQWLNVMNAEIFQDVPVTPGQVYSIYWVWKYTNSASGFFNVPSYEFRDKDHGIIGSNVASSLLYSTSSSAYVTQLMQSTSVAPANAQFLRVYVANSRNSGNPDVRVAKILVQELVQFGPRLISQGTDTYENGQGIAWASSITANPDVMIARNGTARIDVTDGLGNIAFSARSGGTLGIGFYGTAPVAKQTVSGSKGANAALTSLMTALANLGLVINSTT